MLAIAVRVANQIRSNRYSVSCGSYVLGTGDGKVFVLNEQGVTTPKLVENNTQHLVGLYAADTKDGKRVRCPAAEQILGDLLEHFSQMGMEVCS